MLQNTEISPQRRAKCSSVSQQRDGDDSLGPLIERLRLIGFKVPPLCGAHSNVAGGVPMRLSLRNFLQPGPEAERTVNTVLTLLKNQIPLTLSLTDLAGEMPQSLVCNACARFCRGKSRTTIAAASRSVFACIPISCHCRHFRSLQSLSPATVRAMGSWIVCR